MPRRPQPIRTSPSEVARGPFPLVVPYVLLFLFPVLKVEASRQGWQQGALCSPGAGERRARGDEGGFRKCQHPGSCQASAVQGGRSDHHQEHQGPPPQRQVSKVQWVVHTSGQRTQQQTKHQILFFRAVHPISEKELWPDSQEQHTFP